MTKAALAADPAAWIESLLMNGRGPTSGSSSSSRAARPAVHLMAERFARGAG